MTCLLGIDLGTSSVKAVLIDDAGRVLGHGGREYPMLTPKPQFAEQDPAAWFEAAADAVQQAVAGSDVRQDIAAIGFSGHMHGVVLLDANGSVVRPAIIWADQRAAAEADAITAMIVRERLGAVVGTAAATGFMASTLLWLKRHEPHSLASATACVLPKDYLLFRLTGIVGTEWSDASATALFDIRERQWSAQIVDHFGLPGRLLPEVHPSTEQVGFLTDAAARRLGLRSGIPVVAGCADQVAQALGNGLTEPGTASITIGTGGQWFMPIDQPAVDQALRVHTFCHAFRDRWYVLGAMLAAGLSLRWLRDLLGLSGDRNAYARLSALAADVSPGADGLLFLPYLLGERAPHADPHARGAFVGLTTRHQAEHMARAVMEGVAFGMRDIFDVLRTLGKTETLVASGGGLTSPVWRQILADVLGQPLQLTQPGERAGIGAALAAGIGVGLYADRHDIARVVGHNRLIETVVPVPSAVERLESIRAQFQALYPALRPAMHALGAAPA
jgi:xylulokinase